MKFTINRPSAPFKEISWRFKSVPVITSMGGENITFGPGYPGRVRLNATTGSLELLNLTLEDSGLYTVTTRLGGGTELSGQTALTVLGEWLENRCSLMCQGFCLSYSSLH